MVDSGDRDEDRLTGFDRDVGNGCVGIGGGLDWFRERNEIVLSGVTNRCRNGRLETQNLSLFEGNEH